jgi:hypothetical protein
MYKALAALWASGPVSGYIGAQISASTNGTEYSQFEAAGRVVVGCVYPPFAWEYMFLSGVKALVFYIEPAMPHAKSKD